MSLKQLLDRAKSIEEKAKTVLDRAEKELDLTLSEPYTYETAPDWVKKLSKELREAWVKAFNAAYKEYSGDESKAFGTAGAAIEKMGYKKKEVKEAELAEASPSGSIERLREDLNEALKKIISPLLGSYAYIRYIFKDKIIVSGNEGKTYEMSFAIKDKAVAFGAPKEVEEAYVLKEAQAHGVKEIIKEAQIVTLREAQEQDIEVSDFVSLKEAKFDNDFSSVEVVLVEKGTNSQKKRHYPDKTIKEAAPLFSSLKMYINHPTPTEEKERPERNLKDWASTITESHYEDGKAIGIVAVHDNWLRERLKDPVARANIGLSINTGGKISIGKVNGQEMQIVEQIILKRKNGPASVDWVTEPGARGRVSRLLESRTEVSMLETVTLKELKESRSDLVEAIKKESSADISEKLAKTETALKESQVKVAEFEKKEKIAKQGETVEAQLKEAKIPEVSKEKVREHFKSNLIEGDLKEAITKKIAEELDYVNKISGKGKIKLGADNQSTDLKESLQKGLDTRAGIKEEKKEGDE